MGRKPEARPPIDPLLPTELESDIAPPLPFPQDFSFPFLRLPPEVRRKIYRLLYRTNIPIYPSINSLRDTDLARNCKIFPRPSFPTAFLLTNHQIHQEASAVLWGDNQIVFQFPLNWNHEHSQSAEVRRLNWRQPPWFVRRETFVPSVEHLRQIRNLVIEVYLFRSPYTNAAANRPVAPAKKVWEQLTQFVDSIGEEHQIHTCEIRLEGKVTSDNPNEIKVDFKKLKHYSEGNKRPSFSSSHSGPPTSGCCFNHHPVTMLPRGFGRQGLSIEELEVLCRQSVDVDQQVLEPLTKLRGVQNVEVVGRITDDWAQFIKLCMEGKVGTTLDDGVYEHRTAVQWVDPPKRKRSRRR
jgi:hypothetical protein